MSESLLFFSFIISLIYVLINLKYQHLGLIKPLIMFIPIILLSISIILPKNTSLAPVLQSIWLILHVSVTLIGEACFAISYTLLLMYILAFAYKNTQLYSKFHFYFVMTNLAIIFSCCIFFAILVFNKIFKTNYFLSFTEYIVIFILALVINIITFNFLKNMILLNLPSNEILDELSYKIICFGLPIFTLGALVFGMIWAQNAWGRYWNFDPKETWALITWLIYFTYIHLKIKENNNKLLTAYIGVIGFLATLFTYFGVNYFLGGLHSYGSY